MRVAVIGNDASRCGRRCQEVAREGLKPFAVDPASLAGLDCSLTQIVVIEPDVDLGAISQRIRALPRGWRPVVVAIRSNWSDAEAADLLGAGADDLATDDDLVIRLRVAVRRAQVRDEREGRLANLRKALETMQLGVTIADHEGKIVYVNRAEAELHGYEREQLIGRDVRLFAPPALWRPLAGSELLRVGRWTRESMNLRGDGTEFPVRLWSDVVPGADAGSFFVVTICEDLTERKRMEATLLAEQERHAAARGANDGLWDWDVHSGRVEFSRQWAAMLGYRSEQLRSSIVGWLDLVPAEDRGLLRAALMAHVEARSPCIEVEHRIRAADGSLRWVLCRGLAVRDPAGRVTMVAGSQIDISKRKEMDEALRLSEERYALAARGANDGLWDWNLESDEIVFSDRWWAMLGEVPPTETSRPGVWFERIHRDDVGGFQLDLGGHLTGDADQFENRSRLIHVDGSYRWMLIRGLAVRGSDGRATRMAGSMTDITQAKELEERLTVLATRDSLTGTLNRSHVLERLAASVAAAERYGYPLAAGLADLDHFKEINDRFGHVFGDEILAAWGRLLREELRKGDIAGRYGGDEFLLVFPHTAAAGAAQAVERIRRRLQRTQFRGPSNEDLAMTASFGIADLARADEGANELLNRADQALYAAKDAGRDGARAIAAPDRWWEEVRRQRAESQPMAPSLASDEGHWTLDVANDALRISDGWLRTFPLPDGETPTLAAWFAAVHPEDRQILRHDLDLHLQGRTPRFENEHRLRHRDGTYHWVIALGLAECNPQGQALRVAGTVADMTRLTERNDPALSERLLAFGVCSWNHFLERIVESIRTAKRHRFPISLCLLAVDRERPIAVAERDQVMAAVERAFGEVLRAGDIAARYDDRTFGLLLTHTDERAAAAAVERIRRGLLMQLERDDRAGVEGLELVIGATSLRNEMSATDLVEAAREALESVRDEDRMVC